MASVLCFLPPMLETSFQCQAPVASAWAQAIPLQTCKQWTSRSEFSSCLFLSAFHKKWNVFLELFWNVFVSCWKISMTTEYLQEVFLFGALSVWTSPLPSFPALLDQFLIQGSAPSQCLVYACCGWVYLPYFKIINYSFHYLTRLWSLKRSSDCMTWLLNIYN